MNENTKKCKESICLISGTYSCELWEAITECCEYPITPLAIYHTLVALYKNKDIRVSLNFVQALYDIVGLKFPTIIEYLFDDPDECEMYLNELITDIENIL